MAQAWLGLWAVLQVLVWFAIPGKTLTGLSMREARDDAKILMPLVEKYPFVFGILSYVGAPVVIFKRITKHLRDRKMAKKAAVNVAGSTAPQKGAV